MNNVTGITKRQEQVMNCIMSYQKERGISPSVRELCEMSGLASTSSIHSHLMALEKNGYVKWMKGCPRSLVILKPLM